MSFDSQNLNEDIKFDLSVISFSISAFVGIPQNLLKSEFSTTDAHLLR